MGMNASFRFRLARPALVLVLAVLAAFAAMPARAGDVLSPAEVPAYLAATPDVLILDVRTPEEFAGGHLAGALNIPVDSLEARLDEIPADRPLLIHCRMGVRAERAYGIVREKKPDLAQVRMVRGPLEELLK